MRLLNVALIVFAVAALVVFAVSLIRFVQIITTEAPT